MLAAAREAISRSAQASEAGNNLASTYALWSHPLLGLFAVWQVGGLVTGIRSVPLYGALELNLEILPYDRSEAAIHRARDTPEQFVPLAEWWQGRMVPVPQRRWLRLWRWWLRLAD
jgi:hypothetical protein